MTRQRISTMLHPQLYEFKDSIAMSFMPSWDIRGVDVGHALSQFATALDPREVVEFLDVIWNSIGKLIVQDILHFDYTTFVSGAVEKTLQMPVTYMLRGALSGNSEEWLEDRISNEDGWPYYWRDDWNSELIAPGTYPSSWDIAVITLQIWIIAKLFGGAENIYRFIDVTLGAFNAVTRRRLTTNLVSLNDDFKEAMEGYHETVEDRLDIDTELLRQVSNQVSAIAQSLFKDNRQAAYTAIRNRI
jgi:hypothetical protein